LLGDGEVAIDQVRLQVRLDQRDDDDELIDVGDEHVLAAAGGTRQDPATRLDSLNEPLAVARVAEPDAVAGGDDAPLVGDQALEQAADGTAVEGAVFGFDDALETMDADHAPGPAQGVCRGRHSVRAGRRGFVLNDRPATGQVSLGPDPLVGGGCFVFIAVALEAPRPVPVAGRLGAVLP
jgi:hypothetical protein